MLLLNKSELFELSKSSLLFNNSLFINMENYKAGTNIAIGCTRKIKITFK